MRSSTLSSAHAPSSRIYGWSSTETVRSAQRVEARLVGGSSASADAFASSVGGRSRRWHTALGSRRVSRHGLRA